MRAGAPGAATRPTAARPGCYCPPVPTRFTPEIALAHPVVSDASISPDGELIAFVIAAAARPSGPDRPAFAPSAIHVVPAGGGETRQLTYGRADTTPRWSPDGRWLAFLSDREKDGQRQVHLLPRAGGESRQLTHVRGAIPVSAGRAMDPLAWFADGRRVAFLMQEPLDEADEAREKAGDDPIVFEERPRWIRVWSVDVATGEVEPISPAGLQVWEFTLSPDGTRVGAIASDHPYEWDWYDARVVAFDVGGAELTTLHRSWRQVSKPAWSPDGRTLAFLTSNLSDRGIDAGEIRLVGPEPGDARAPAAVADVTDIGASFLADGHILALANVHGGTGLGVIDPATGARRWLWSERRTTNSVTRTTLPDGRPRFAAVIDDLEAPPEVHVGELVDDQIAWRRLTAIHDPWRDVERGEARDVTWAGDGGLAMQGYLFLPPGHRSGPLPLVTVVHGGPTGCVRFEYQYGARWIRPLADAGLAVFVPNFRGSTGWGLEFAEANIGDMGGADLQDILLGIDRLVADGVADPDRLGIAGWSYGGFMTAWAITQTDRFKAAMAGAGISDWRSFHGRSYLHRWDRLHYGNSDPYDPASHHARFSPLTHVRNARTPTLILHGEQDWDVPVEQAYILHRALKDLGVDTRLVIYPREAHGISESAHRLDLLTRLRDWFVEHLRV